MPSRKIQLQDDIAYLEYVANGGGVGEFMKKVAVWGEDLTAYRGFSESVEANVKKITAGDSLI